ncbi:hypothetical protein P167DRAFT_535912 [Morchella conica CCBAS932]|uniref:Uncharacterized protein n=1 Tax=Morchella conica CCBAS932 TaxID=1392247 RepID=A0A3N4L3J3_9PEZI|nr:hypothetical protein P167DRAFT_535912 [Morchella conica CCBAS932]
MWSNCSTYLPVNSSPFAPFIDRRTSLPSRNSLPAYRLLPQQPGLAYPLSISWYTTHPIPGVLSDRSVNRARVSVLCLWLAFILFPRLCTLSIPTGRGGYPLRYRHSYSYRRYFDLSEVESFKSGHSLFTYS